MRPSNRQLLPVYCQPDIYLPEIPDSKDIFANPPLLFTDFAARALGFVRSENAREMGLKWEDRHCLPCTWRCADESTFPIDQAVYALTGNYPFAKGGIGALFNDAAIGAAVHHAPINLDIGGAHVGYQPNKDGRFGFIERPLHDSESTDCGYLMNVMAPFAEAYNEAARRIRIFTLEDGTPVMSIPNRYDFPSAPSSTMRLLVDLERLTDDSVTDLAKAGKHHAQAGRGLFALNPEFVAGLSASEKARLLTNEPTSIGASLTSELFHIWDTQTAIDSMGLPRPLLLAYMNQILADPNTPPPLKAAIVTSETEHRRLVEAVGREAYREYSFISFSGVIIDLYDAELNGFVNLFAPIGMALKPGGTREVLEMDARETYALVNGFEPAEPVHPLKAVMGFEPPKAIAERFAYRP